MDREQAIDTIKHLYPADSEYAPTAEIGKRLLEQAKMEVQGWRTEPTEVLIRYAHLCMQEENNFYRKNA